MSRGDAVRLPGSFRDPAGFVYEQGGRLYRQVNAEYRADYDHLMQSGLYATLVEHGLLVSHTEVDSTFATSGAYRTLAPERVPFISYPFEWCFSQLRAAAQLTLRVQRIALDHGMSLKDASAFNVQFIGCRPVLIDTLSFEIYNEGQPWVAYRQFCQHFLAPLELMATTDARLGQLSRIFLDGPPLDLVSRLLPWQTRLRLMPLLHVHLHSRNQDRFASEESRPKAKLSRQGLVALIDHLERGIHKLKAPKFTGAWTQYYEDADYSSVGSADKESAIARWLDRLEPKMLWDVGANDGRFSRPAARRGIVTIALDSDVGAIERGYLDAFRDDAGYFLPLVIDVTNPSTGMGWAGCERDSLWERGPADVVMALALVHHLTITNHVPLEAVAEFLARLGRAVIVEWVPREDRRVRRLLANRGDDCEAYNLEAFEAAFSRVFKGREKQSLRDTERVLYLFTNDSNPS